MDQDGVLHLTLNHPAARNALSLEMIMRLQEAFDAAAKDPSARVIILKGVGSVFSSGHDLKEMRAEPALGYYQQLFAQCGRMMMSLQRLPVPVIVVGNVVVGGGCAKWTPVGLPRQNRVLCVGRICEEAHGGRLNQASVQLEGSRGHSMGSTIALDLSGLLGNDGGDVGDRGNREYGCSLFPGQIVAVEGDQSLREDHEGDARDRGRRAAAACVDRGRCIANVLVVVVSGRKLPR